MLFIPKLQNSTQLNKIKLSIPVILILFATAKSPTEFPIPSDFLSVSVLFFIKVAYLNNTFAFGY